MDKKIIRNIIGTVIALSLVLGSFVTTYAATDCIDGEITVPDTDEVQVSAMGVYDEDWDDDGIILGDDEEDWGDNGEDIGGDEEDWGDDEEDDEDDGDDEGDDEEESAVPEEVGLVAVSSINHGTNNGRAPQYTAKISEGNAAVAYEGWICSDGTVSYSKSSAYSTSDDRFGTFESGKKYSYVICLEAKEPDYFTSDTAVLLNGKWVNASVSRDGKRIYVRDSYTETSVCYHDYTRVVVKPTCIEKGHTDSTCKYCGYSYTGNYTDVVDHVYKKNKKSPTCTVDGSYTYTCKTCGYQYVEPIKAPGHEITEEIEPASDEEYGRIISTCDVCQKTVSKVTIPRIGAVSLKTTSYTFDGKDKKPAVIAKDVTGMVIPSDYYSVEYFKNKNAGTGEVIVTFKDLYECDSALEFTIKQASQSISAKVSSKKFTKSAVAKKAQSFSIGATCKTSLKYKSSSKYVTVSSAGKVTVKKGTPKGTYKITVTAVKNTNYKQATKTVTVKVS